MSAATSADVAQVSVTAGAWVGFDISDSFPLSIRANAGLDQICTLTFRRCSDSGEISI